MIHAPGNWRSRPPYAAAEDPFHAVHRAACHCGAVRFEVRADPVDSKLCHCPRCRTLHGAPFQWAVIFHKHDVRFTAGLDCLHFYSGETGRPGYTLPCKLSCGVCRAPVADEGRRMFLAFGPLFDLGSPPLVPETFRPTCHIFYGQRVVDVPDGLPKYSGHKDTSSLVPDR